MKNTLAVAIIGLVSGSASAAYLSNGEFEIAGTSGADFGSWIESGSMPASVLSNGIKGQSLLLSATASDGYLTQVVSGGNNRMAVDLDLALTAATASQRTFTMFVRHSLLNDQINFRVIDTDGKGGDIAVYNGSTLTTILSNVLTFSTSQSDLKVNHLRIEVDYKAGSFVIIATNAAGQSTPSEALTSFQIGNNNPVTESSVLKQLVFYTSANNVSGSWAVVDNVVVSDLAVPEPAAFSVLTLAGGIMLGYRRKSK